MSIELRNGTIYVGVDLGSTVEQSGETLIKCGSLLDDFQWHDVKVRRMGKSITVVVDQLKVHNESLSLFSSFNFDGRLYVGGAPSHVDRGILIRSNFMGCIENVIYRSYTENRIIDILKGVRYLKKIFLFNNTIFIITKTTKKVPVIFFLENILKILTKKKNYTKHIFYL